MGDAGAVKAPNSIAAPGLRHVAQGSAYPFNLQSNLVFRVFIVHGRFWLPQHTLALSCESQCLLAVEVGDTLQASETVCSFPEARGVGAE